MKQSYKKHTRYSRTRGLEALKREEIHSVDSQLVPRFIQAKRADQACY
jgi:hypothetical protein